MQGIIMIGLPGSGKSTLATQYVEQGYTVISADKVREDLYGDPAIQGDSAEVWGEFYRRFQQLLETEADIVVDNTSVRSRDRKILLEYFHRYGYSTRYLLMDTPLEECLRRNAQRSRKVPEEIILKMAVTLQNNRSLLSGECPTTVV